MGSNTRTKRYYGHITLHKNMKFYIKDFLSKCDQIRSFLRIWSYLLKKSLMENFMFCAVLNLKFALVGLVGLTFVAGLFLGINRVSVFSIFYNFVILYVHILSNYIFN